MIDKTNKTTSKKKSKQNASLKKKNPKSCRTQTKAKPTLQTQIPQQTTKNQSKNDIKEEEEIADKKHLQCINFIKT